MESLVYGCGAENGGLFCPLGFMITPYFSFLFYLILFLFFEKVLCDFHL